MKLDKNTLAQLAEHLENAELKAHDVTKITDDHPDMDWDDAYAVQDAIRARKLARGARIVALDERGTSLTTQALAQQVTQWQLGGDDVALVIGVGIMLFVSGDDAKKPAKPTPAGRLLLKHTMQMRLLHTDLERDLHKLSPGTTGSMREDDRVFLMGEDVGKYGGTYAVSKGFIEEFGPARIRDTPLSELGFVGAGIGAAADSDAGIFVVNSMTLK